MGPISEKFVKSRKPGAWCVKVKGVYVIRTWPDKPGQAIRLGEGASPGKTWRDAKRFLEKEGVEEFKL